MCLVPHFIIDRHYIFYFCDSFKMHGNPLVNTDFNEKSCAIKSNNKTNEMDKNSMYKSTTVDSV